MVFIMLHISRFLVAAEICAATCQPLSRSVAREAEFACMAHYKLWWFAHPKMVGRLSSKFFDVSNAVLAIPYCCACVNIAICSYDREDSEIL